jgi:predicted amidohydrolase YtcJ
VAEVGGTVPKDTNTKLYNLEGRTAIPGIIDPHNHIVLVGSRPGRSTGAEDLFTIPDLIERYVARAAEVPPGELITTIGPISAMAYAEQRLPNVTELDAVPRPVDIQAAQAARARTARASPGSRARASRGSAPTERSPAACTRS